MCISNTNKVSYISTTAKDPMQMFHAMTGSVSDSSKMKKARRKLAYHSWFCFNNSFSGVIPDIFANATKLRSLDISNNQLEGKFPKSLINCKHLQTNSKTGFHHGSLPSLHVLILRSNESYGPLYHRHMSIGFQSLRVIDTSHNDFIGNLPSKYFSNWREMNTLTKEKDE
ncbi:LOW QUALITY PROTEIN: hypothetical protein YC2023_091922 [Brassica napus]